jgi:hypothetical protein
MPRVRQKKNKQKQGQAGPKPAPSKKAVERATKRAFAKQGQSTDQFGQVMDALARRDTNAPGYTKQQSAAKRQAVPGVNMEARQDDAQPNQNSILPVQPVANQMSFAFSCLGGMQQAVAAGFEDFATTNNLPGGAFFAYVFLTNLLYGYITNNVPQTIKVPLWLDELGCALMSTEQNFMQGKISYSFPVDESFPAALQWDPSAIFDNYFLATSAPTVVVNGYSTMIAPASYTSELGQQAYNLLTKFTANVEVYPGWKGVDVFSSWTKKDSSAFAASWVQMGGDATTVGGGLIEIMHETALTAPLFGVFAQWQNNTPKRYFRHSHPWSGDAFHLGYTLTQFFLKRQLKSKLIPKFKQVDFFEYMDVLSLWLAKAMTLAMQNTTQNQNNTPLVCPLTWQDVGILLRQAIGSCWSPCLFAGQFLANDGPSNPSAFFPFTWGTNCYPGSNVNGMSLPIILVEAIRSLQGTYGNVDFKNPRTGKVTKGGLATIYPVLGMYKADIPNLTSLYLYESSPMNFTDVYTSPLGQVAMDFIDCHTDQPVTDTIINVNSSAIGTNLALWNNFVVQLKANSCAFEMLGTDKPAKTLHSISLTQVSALISVPQKEKEKKFYGRTVVAKSSVRVSGRVEVSEDKKVTIMAPPYDTYGTLETVSQSEILKAIWTAWYNVIVLPSVRISGNPADQTTPLDYIDYGTSENEPYAIPQSTFDIDLGVLVPAETLTQRHDRFASTMVRPTNSPATALEVFLLKELEHGRGGTLGSMFGGLAGNFLEPASAGRQSLDGTSVVSRV